MYEPEELPRIGVEGKSYIDISQTRYLVLCVNGIGI